MASKPTPAPRKKQHPAADAKGGSFRNPPAKISAATQAGLYYARKRRIARI